MRASFQAETIHDFSYHWFWKLRHHPNRQQNNWSTAFVQWRKNPEKIRRIQERQAKIDSYPLPIRWFCWVLNLWQYAENFYRLAAFYVSEPSTSSIHITKDENIMGLLKDIQKFGRKCLDQVAETGGKLKNLITPQEEKPADPSAPSPQQPAASGTDTPQTPMSVPAAAAAASSRETPTFTVTTEMLQHLCVFGIAATVGTPVSCELLKATYHEKLLRAHPDHGGTADSFRILRTAWQALDRLIHNKQDGTAHELQTSAQEYEAFYAEQVWQKKVAEVRREYQGLAQAAADTAKGIEEHRQEREALRQTREALRQEREALRQEREALRQDFASQDLVLERGQEALAEIQKQLAEKTATENLAMAEIRTQIEALMATRPSAQAAVSTPPDAPPSVHSRPLSPTPSTHNEQLQTETASGTVTQPTVFH